MDTWLNAELVLIIFSKISNSEGFHDLLFSASIILDEDVLFP